MRLTNSVALLMTLGSMSCATWEKPGATLADRDAQIADCTAVSFQQAPAAPVEVVTDSGGWKAEDKECWKEHGQKKCDITPAHYEEPTYGTKDSNEGPREAFFRSCMYDAGWVRNYPGM